MNEEQIPIGNVLTTKIPNLHLIPTESLVRLANRFQLGIDKKGRGAWNALSDNQSCLTNKELILDRIGHTIHHCLKLRDKIQNNEDPFEDDDSGAIAWAGAFFCCATKALQSQKKGDAALTEWMNKKEAEINRGLERNYKEEVENNQPISVGDLYVKMEEMNQKEVEMDYGFFLFNTVTLRVFGTNCYSTEEEANEAIKKLEVKWEDRPTDRRNLRAVKVKFTDILEIEKEDSQQGIDEALENIKKSNLIAQEDSPEVVGVYIPPMKNDGSTVNPFKRPYRKE